MEVVSKAQKTAQWCSWATWRVVVPLLLLVVGFSLVYFLGLTVPES